MFRLPPSEAGTTPNHTDSSRSPSHTASALSSPQCSALDKRQCRQKDLTFTFQILYFLFYYIILQAFKLQIWMIQQIVCCVMLTHSTFVLQFIEVIQVFGSSCVLYTVIKSALMKKNKYIFQQAKTACYLFIFLSKTGPNVELIREISICESYPFCASWHHPALDHPIRQRKQSLQGHSL